MLCPCLIMSKQPNHLVIFTDLDGTLLDHHNYSAKPAARLIERLYDQGTADIIPVTSKTQSELLWLRKSIPLQNILSVTENGSVIHACGSSPLVDDDRSHSIMLGIRYRAILEQVAKLPQSLRHHITGFADMPVEQVMAATGLRLDDARRAQDREATEPFLWSGSASEFSALREILIEENIQVQRGGRFYHLTGQATKENAMAKIISAFVEKKPDFQIISIALGDGPNDLAMIEAADFGVIMPNPDGVTIETAKPHVRTAPVPGPEGWVMAVQEILAELGLNLPES